MSDAPAPPLARLCAALGVAAFGRYVFTLAPTYGWGDSADLAMRMVTRDDGMFEGSSRDYVLYRAVAGIVQALPFGDAGYRANLAVDPLPGESQEDVRAQLIAQKEHSPQKHVANELPAAWRQALSKRLWERLLIHSGIDGGQTWASVPQKALNRLSETLKRAVFPVRGKGVFKDEFVTAGGVALADIDCRTMESRHAPGLYFAGEILDIDGITGGFNFQNAWATGWLAGQALGRQT